MNILFFSSQAEFRKWLSKNHKKETELIVGYYKIASGKPSMTWSQSVDQALCFGWIDGIRRSIDEESYCIRFTPRKPTSIWSSINIQKAKELTKAGLMHAQGIKAFEIRNKTKSGIYAHENTPSTLNKHFEKQFKLNKQAWSFFSNQSTSYKKMIIHWIMSAKQETTQLSRLNKTIIASVQQVRIPQK